LRERECKLRVGNKYSNNTLISCYAPTEDKEGGVKEQFYEEIQRLVENVPKSDTIIILGDSNAQLGKEEVYSPITGKHTLHEKANRNGDMLCDLAVTHNLVVMRGTQFQQEQIRKGTWTSPEKSTVNQIDHILMNNQKKDLVEDVRTMRGPNFDSDNFLTRLVLKQALPAIYRRRNTGQST
jgi:exonuclease III